MSDHSDTLELRRMVEADPVHPGAPDLPALIGASRRRQVRRRAAIGGTALAAVTAVVVPTLLLAGGPGDRATDRTEPSTADRPSAATGDDPTCGVLSCLRDDSRERGEVLAELPVGPIGDGEEVVYLVRTRGVDLGTQEEGMVTVLKAGYRLGGELYSTLWGPQPGFDGRAPRPFWYNAGYINAKAGTGGHYVVVGYVDGTPDAITWSTPDGETGAVGGMQAVGDHTIFYVHRPLPDDYEPPAEPEVYEDEDGNKLLRIGDTEPFRPRLTIHTSDGWSCALAKCGSTG